VGGGGGRRRWREEEGRARASACSQYRLDSPPAMDFMFLASPHAAAAAASARPQRSRRAERDMAMARMVAG